MWTHLKGHTVYHAGHPGVQGQSVHPFGHGTEALGPRWLPQSSPYDSPAPRVTLGVVNFRTFSGLQVSMFVETT